MNKRMIELLNESGLDIRHEGLVLTKNVSGGEAVEKFAELIVKECAGWMENATVTDSTGNKDHIGDSFFWADELKKHFGVK